MRTGPCEFARIALAAVCSLPLACSSTSGSASSGAAENGASGSVGDGGGASIAGDAGSGCTGYSGTVDSYDANLSKTGSSGQIQFVLVDAQPAPPEKGDNTWTLKLLDVAGAPIQNATFTIKTWMPLMRHGSSITPKQTVNADGTYTISLLYLIMPGIWQVTFTAQAGSMKDTAMYTFCVDG